MHVFSFCIYGPHHFYYRGLEENIKLIREYYPDWHIFVYVGADATQEFLHHMKLYPNTHWIPPGCSGNANMVWRFFAIDNPEVETMHVRDADSRCHVRDRWCIDKFMESSYLAYTIRDNPGHQIRIMGGLWGCRKLPFSMRHLYLKNRKAILSRPHEFGYDQDFLARCVWDCVKSSFASYGYARVESEEHYTPIDASLPDRPYCGMVE
jgi:hypothetical protein